MPLQFIEIAEDDGQVTSFEWLARAEPVHRQLRPQLPQDYVGRMQQVLANGARLLLAVNDGKVLGVALWRLIENTAEGLRLYVDDLVTDEAVRSGGVGKQLLSILEQRARAAGCAALTLDSGVARIAAHKFYFREGMHIPSFCFKKTLL